MVSKIKMLVTFLRNNFEDVNVSMRIYGDAIGAVFRKEYPDIELHNISPESHFARAFAGKSAFLGRLRNYWERFSLYPRLLKSLNSDIFHILDHSFSYLLKYISNAKTVVTCHDLILLKAAIGHFEGEKAPWFAHHLFKNSVTQMGKADRIIAVSANTKRDIVKLLRIDPAKIEIIHQGIDTNLFSLTSERNRPVADDKNNREFRILHVGGNLFYKNMNGIINVLNLLKPELKERLTLVKVGGLSPSNLKLLSKYGLASRLELHGNPTKENLPGIYRSCDLFFFPSLYEGFGAPPLEAMGCGIPVIASDRGSLPEICGDAALYVDPLDLKMMAEAVESVLTDRNLRQKLIAKGLERARFYTWKSTAVKTLAVYREVLKK